MKITNKSGDQTCRTCKRNTTPKGKTCYTTVKMLKELIRDKNLVFSPYNVIDAMLKIGNSCNRYEDERIKQMEAEQK